MSSSSSPGAGEGSGGQRLRRELEQLRKRQEAEQREWNEERKGLRNELGRWREEEEGRLELSRERLRLSMIEEKIKEVLGMLRCLNTMSVPSQVVGRMVVEAVEKAWDPVSAQVQVFPFLAILYKSTRDWEEMEAESNLTSALLAVGCEGSDSSSSIPEGMATLRPRRPEQSLVFNKEDLYRINI